MYIRYNRSVKVCRIDLSEKCTLQAERMKIRRKLGDTSVVSRVIF